MQNILLHVQLPQNLLEIKHWQLKLINFLGFGLSSDFSMIRQALPHLSFNQKHIGFLDLFSLWKQLEKQQKITLPYENQGKDNFLWTLKFASYFGITIKAVLVEICLGLKFVTECIVVDLGSKSSYFWINTLYFIQ